MFIIKRNHVVRLVLIFTIIMGISSLTVMLGGVMRERNNSYITIDPETMDLVQLKEPEEGAPIAVMDTTLGEIRFVLYPDRSPNAVANFTELANSGYYNNTFIFHSESGVYSMGGAPNKDGSAKDDSHERVERELNQDLWPFKGAICVMNTTVKQSLKDKILGGGTYYNGSRFLILNTVEFTEEFNKELRESSESEKLADAFIEKGGVPNFSQQMTVIGQIYSGMEVAEKLAGLETKSGGAYNFPVEDVMINSVTIGKYSSEEEKDRIEK